MSNQKSHRIDLDYSSPCEYCGKESYTEYLCHPKYGRIHTDYHRYCPKCQSYKQTDDGGFIYCPKCITMYEEEQVVQQAQARNEALRQEKQKKADECINSVFIVFSLFMIWVFCSSAWLKYYSNNMDTTNMSQIS